jgi:alkylation response protein AidB-like acyl-CoA dehydrogenase
MECYAEPPGLGGLSDDECELLARAQHVADTVLGPRAEETDRSSDPPADNLRRLAEAGLLGVTTPREWGGSGCSGTFMRAFTERLTAACGTTWFTLTQHLGACGMLAGSENPSPRERFLRDMAAGRHLVGVGFGHLRRPQPMLRAEPVSSGGWRLTGVSPWVTGWPILDGVVYGATLPDERHLYVYVPAEESDALRSSPPLPLCAMNGSATTEVRFESHFVPGENFVKYSSRDEMARGDTHGIAGAVSPPLGCARGSVKSLRATAEKRRLGFLREAADALDAEINACRAEAFRWADGPKDTPDYKPGALKARAWAIELAVRAAHAAVASASGAANSLDHPAQRRFREAMFYTLIAQTGDVMAATVARLTAQKTDAP